MLSDAPRRDSDGAPTPWPRRSAPAVDWLFGGCPRCKGALLSYFREVSCLACGWCGPTARGTLPDPPREGRLRFIGEAMLLGKEMPPVYP